MKTLKIDDELHRRFKTLCAAHEIQMIEAADEIIRRWVESWERQTPDHREKSPKTQSHAIHPQ